jgi:acyl transferase domain-containing protein
MNSSDGLDRIEAILAATAVQQQANTAAIDRLTDRVDRIAVQQQANTEVIGRLEAQTLANATALDRLTDRVDSIAVQQQASTELLDRLVDRVDRMVSAIGSHQEALRLISQQHNEWREQMRIIQTEIRDIWQYLNNQLRNRGNGGGQN